MSKKVTPPSSLRLRGTVVAFNISPKGHIQGAMVETAKGLAQVNFPKHDCEALARSLHTGSTLEMNVELETSGKDHPVFRASDGEGEVSGAIVRLNYTLHGAVNGYHLEDGTFVHVKPVEAKKYKLRVGETVTAKGKRHTGADAVTFEPRALGRVALAGESLLDVSQERSGVIPFGPLPRSAWEAADMARTVGTVGLP